MIAEASLGAVVNPSGIDYIVADPLSEEGIRASHYEPLEESLLLNS